MPDDNITISGSYTRRVNLGNYEHAEATITFGGRHENTGGLVVAEQLAQQAKTAVERVLNLVPKTTTTVEVANAPPVPADPAPAKNPVGRPKGSTKTAPKPVDPLDALDDKAEVSAIADKEEAALVDKIVEKVDELLAAEAKPEAPAEKPVARQVGDSEMQTAAAQAVAKVGAPAVKKLMKDNYRVDRLSDIEQYLREAFLKDLSGLTK